MILKSTLEIIQTKRNLDPVDISKLLELIGSCRAHSLDFLEFKRIVCPTNPQFISVSSCTFKGPEETLDNLWLSSLFEVMSEMLRVDRERRQLKHKFRFDTDRIWAEMDTHKLDYVTTG